LRGRNAKIQAFAGAVVMALLLAGATSRAHIPVVVLCVSLVLALEILNTAVERLCDLVDELHTLGQDARIRDIKDLAAGAVLLAAVGSATIGVLVFGPELVAQLTGG